jgi:steroid delta-isomerase-like uncharacterized protein
MTRDEIVAVFETRRKAWEVRDAEALASTHAEGGTVQSPMFGSLRGHEAIAKSYSSLFRTFPDWNFLDEALIIDGARVAQPFSATATHSADFMGLPASGRKFRIQGVRLHTMKDGKILEEQRIYDFTGLLIQVGVLKSKPAV